MPPCDCVERQPAVSNGCASVSAIAVAEIRLAQSSAGASVRSSFKTHVPTLGCPST
jgi:hypothetical protein